MTRYPSEILRFAFVLAGLVSVFFAESLFGGKVLSPADVLFVSASFREVAGPDYEPANRLLMDPVLQFQPWLEFSRNELREGRLPLWNPYAGCGAPHLANGQSAVFDPFHLIAYLGRLPGAIAPMAAARLWTAGMGMFLLARAWGIRRRGRWFAGLIYPFTGFMVGWLLYPVTSVATWFPWVILASDRVIDRPGRLRIGWMGLAVAACLLGGHVQTSAHILIAVGLNMIRRGRTLDRRGFLRWTLGMILGVGLAAIEILPLAEYLAKSPVWTDRSADRVPPWKFSKPRVLDAVCTGFPYAFGSQREGHPNLARPLGVDNLNESAGGFAGLATLIWLAPLGVVANWRRVDRKGACVRWLASIVILGLMAGFRIPPVDNILRALPVLNVTDNRRLTIWVAFGLCLLGGHGLDRLGAVRRGRGWPRWTTLWVVVSLGMLVVAMGIPIAKPAIAARARRHYEEAARSTPGADPAIYQARAERQTRDMLRFVPRYYGVAGAELLGLAGLCWLVRSRRGGLSRLVAPGLLGITMVELLGYGIGLNPAIEPRDDRPITPLIARLREIARPPARVLGLGEELPPNVAMRYGLADIRNYDSIELALSLAAFSGLYPPETGERTSRRATTWEGVLRASDTLRLAGVRAIVSASPPPDGAFTRVEKIGSVWLARPEGGDGVTKEAVRSRPGQFHINTKTKDREDSDRRILIRETWDPNWIASNGALVRVGPGGFISVEWPEGVGEVLLEYSPWSVRVGGLTSVFCGLLAAFALTGPRGMPSSGRVPGGAGRTRALGHLPASPPHRHPDDPTGVNSRKTR